MPGKELHLVFGEETGQQGSWTSVFSLRNLVKVPDFKNYTLVFGILYSSIYTGIF